MTESYWRYVNRSLEFLPPKIRNQLADELDIVTSLGLGYPSFAAALCINGRETYSAGHIELIKLRSQPGSATRALLLDYEQRGGTIQGVQYALESINHRASQIIPSYVRSIETQYVQALNNSGLQNTENSPCNCPRCQGQRQSSDTNGRSSSQMREEDVLSRSVYTGSSNGAKIKSSKTSRSSRDGSRVSNSPPVPSYVDENRDQAFVQRELCHCEECRLRSDPEQTQRFTLESDPKIACSDNKGPFKGITELDLMRESANSAEHTDTSGLSQLYLDSYESEGSSVGNSDETFVKSVVTESQRSDRVEMPKQNVSIGNSPPKHNNKWCSKSNNGQHRLGEQPEVCSVCRHHAGARPKKQSSGSYKSTADRNEQENATPLRKSWHGPSNDKPDEELLKSWSDSSLVVSKLSGSNTHHPNDSNSVEETLYSRISFGTSGSSSITDSANNVYRNNLESDAANNSLGGTRNIVPSDSSNFTDGQIPFSTYLNKVTRVTNAQDENTQLSRKPARNGFGGPKVFVTYAWNGNTDSESFIQEVIEMCVSLREKDIRTKIDMDDQSYSSLMLNKLDWIDRNVREAKYIIVCITPTYYADIREPDPRNAQASPRSSQLNARYIFNTLREEYHRNSSQNRRVIPVIFSNHKTTNRHLPECMRSTLVYEYPDNIEHIISAILGHGRYRPS